MKKSKSLFKVYGTLFLASFLMVMSGAPHASAIGNQLTSSTQENAKTRVNPSSIRESLKNAPAEEWWVYGVVAGGNTHVYMR